MNEVIEDTVQLIYASRMAKGCGPKDLEAILDISRKKNPSIGVTGALCYSARGFLQCLEGSRSAVNTLYRRIVQDERNEDITLISYEHITERTFGQWSMAYVRADGVDAKILKKHKVDQDFDPFSVTPKQAIGLLRDMARERAAFLAQQQKGE